MVAVVEHNSNYILLNRKILRWELWEDHNATRLFLYVLLKANFKDVTDEKTGITVPRGSLKTTLRKLCEDTGLNFQQVRTSLKKLILTKSLTESVTKKTKAAIRIITVVKYDEYQFANKIDNKIINNSSYYIKKGIIKNDSFCGEENKNCAAFLGAAQNDRGDEVE